MSSHTGGGELLFEKVEGAYHPSDVNQRVKLSLRVLGMNHY